MNEKLESTGGCLLMIVFMGYGLLQIWAGYIGIEYHLGGGWAKLELRSTVQPQGWHRPDSGDRKGLQVFHQAEFSNSVS
tara:strand:+ start:2205 stop:2441 length:237 start_codon:yes stop_codon:yes gene_type:complete